MLQPTALADPLPAAPARRARARAQIFPPDEKIDAINDTYWTVRAEPDDDAEEAGAGPSSLIHVYHYHADAQNHVRARQRPGHPWGTSMRALAPHETLHADVDNYMRAGRRHAVGQRGESPAHALPPCEPLNISSARTDWSPLRARRASVSGWHACTCTRSSVCTCQLIVA